MLRNEQQSELPYVKLKDSDKKSYVFPPISFLYSQTHVSSGTKSDIPPSEALRKKLKDELVRCLPSQKIKEHKSTEYELEQEANNINQLLSNQELSHRTTVLRDIFFDGSTFSNPVTLESEQRLRRIFHAVSAKDLISILTIQIKNGGGKLDSFIFAVLKYASPITLNGLFDKLGPEGLNEVFKNSHHSYFTWSYEQCLRYNRSLSESEKKHLKFLLNPLKYFKHSPEKAEEMLNELQTDPERCMRVKEFCSQNFRNKPQKKYAKVLPLLMQSKSEELQEPLLDKMRASKR